MKNRIRTGSALIIFVVANLFSGCDSAEAIKQYSYSTTTANLKKAVKKILESNKNPNVIWDSGSYLLVKRYRDEYKDKPWYTTAMDTLRPANYRGSFYWITIKEKGVDYNYGFDYLGSAIVLDELWNNKGLDLRQGENVGDFSSPEANAAKALFEREFVEKLDDELKLKHSH